MTALEHALSSRTEGKTKILEPSSVQDELLVTFKDTATAFNGQKKEEISGKGTLNARISALLFQYLEKNGISTCYLKAGKEDNQLIYKSLKMISLEVVVRNIALGSVVKRYGFSEGMRFKKPIVELFYKSQNDPLISDSVVLALNLVENAEQLNAIRIVALKINDLFQELFAQCGITCADFKLEFGFDPQGKLLLGDELSPDNFRLRDSETGEILDKDLFRLDLGDVSQADQKLLEKLNSLSIDEKCSSQKAFSGKSVTYDIDVCVHSRKGILNPESRTVFETVKVLGYDNMPGVSIQKLSAGKRFELQISAPDFYTAELVSQRLANEVLSNPVIEDFTVTIR
jgi:phosphoribosylaminoimidazole-succinocarboxamide synthase